MAAASSSASSATPLDYDVFLSFCGRDTRTSFTDHLYSALVYWKIRVFRDREGLQSGEKISELFRAIERSEIFIPIFSENYASSEWCLEEVRKIHDFNSKAEKAGEETRLIIPVFYRIEPGDVGSQRGKFGIDFEKHEKNKELAMHVCGWRKAPQEIAGISGLESEKIADGYEAPLVDKIVERVRREIDKRKAHEVAEHPVGINSRVKEIIERLNLNSEGARILAINGMGGLGKTTIATAVYRELKGRFQFHGLIKEEASHKEGKLINFQRQMLLKLFGARIPISDAADGTSDLSKMLTNREVLIIIDDVDSAELIERLVGKRERYHPGSRIIITTRDARALDALSVRYGWSEPEIYGLRELDEKESLELFSWYAFGRNSPASGYEKLSSDIVNALHGLPWAIRTLASTLCNKTDKKLWDEALDRLTGLRVDGLYLKLKENYDQLSNKDHRSVFLDVACFLSGIDKKTAVHIWDACGLGSRSSINALVEKSLIKIVDGKLEMYSLLREMGKRIVEEEPTTGPEARSRLWNHQEIMDVLQKRKGTSKIEGINLIMECEENGSRKGSVGAAGFANMDRLRLLMMNHVNLKGKYKKMPDGIKWLQWQRCPLKSLPRDFRFSKVAALDLSYSNITKLQTSNNILDVVLKHIERREVKGTVFKMLKFLDLTACNELTVTPDLSVFPGLETLVLDHCQRLEKVHESIANLKLLLTWSMSSCIRLKKLPDCISQLTSLQHLILANCTRLQRLPDCIGQLKSYSLKVVDTSNCPNLRFGQDGERLCIVCV